MKRYINNGLGDVTYTKVVVILADNPIEGYDNTYYISEYKMYLKTHEVTIKSCTGTIVGSLKLHDNLVNEISGNAPVSIALCAQATFENGKMRSEAVNWGILSKGQLDYINRLIVEGSATSNE